MSNYNVEYKPTVEEYLNFHFFVVCTAIFVIFTALVVYMNYAGMDDTSEYYMQYEAQVLSEHYKPGDKIIEFDPGVKEYYWGEQLPEAYRQLLEGETLEDNTIAAFEYNGQTLYLLSLLQDKSPEPFYVVHIFPQGVYALSDHKVFYAVIVLAVLLLVGVFVYIYKANQQVGKATDDMYQWVRQLIHLDIVNQAPHKLDPPMPYSELDRIAFALHHSLTVQHQLTVHAKKMMAREKSFLSTLSHELRTPISIISAALALLDKQPDLPPKSLDTLAKLRRANTNMKGLADTLLMLWRQQDNDQSAEMVDLGETVKASVASIEAQFGDDLQLTTHVFGAASVETQSAAVQMVINNLIRNACQYTSDGKVTVTATGTGLIVSNKFAAPEVADNDGLGNDSNIQYGYGFGLYLVETLCNRLNWPFVVTPTGDRFTVNVGFE